MAIFKVNKRSIVAGLSSSFLSRISDILPKKFPVSLSYLKLTSLYLFTIYACRFLCVLRGFINAKWLGPELYGFWGVLMFMVSFGYHLHLGTQEMVIKNVPKLISLGRKGEVEKVIRLSSTFFTIMLGAASLGFWLAALTLPPGTPALFRMGWVVAGITLLIEILFYFEQTVARAEGKLGCLSKALFWANLSSLVLTISLVPFFGLPGLYAAATLPALAGLLYLRASSDYSRKFMWLWSDLRPMLKAGWPIALMTVIFEAPGWIDRLVILAYVGTSDFGYYVLAVMAAQLFFLFPHVVVASIEPKLHHDFPQNGKPVDILPHLWIPLKMLSQIMPLAIAAFELVLPAMIEGWLPAYKPAIPAIRILVWGSLFMGFAISTKPFIVAINGQKSVLGFYLAAIALNIYMSVTLLRSGFGILGAAIGTTIAYGFCSLALLGFAFWKIGWKPRVVLSKTLSLYTPALVVASSVILLPSFASKLFPSIPPQPITMFRISAFAICLLIFFWQFRELLDQKRKLA